MSEIIGRAVIAVDSSSAKAAVADLDKFAASAENAGNSALRASDKLSFKTITPAHLFSANKSLADFRKSSQEAAASAASAADTIVQAHARVEAAAGKSTRAHQQVEKASQGYTKSAKELAFATRNLPAQFTDIAVSLQAGQNPLTVMLQQGGQLKDIFGGIGPAAKAMGNYILGLLNPYALAAAAVAVLTIAWHKGEAETVAFNKSIALTGNFAGTTADSLNDMARSMVDFGTSQGKAAAALAEVTASGKFTEAQIRMVGKAALDMKRATGQAVGETIKEFVKLGDSPVKSVLELNKSFHFLTTSTYEQIKALEKQGDTLGAAEVAMNAYADAIEDRTEGVMDNLGTLQRGWLAVKGAAAAAWGAMLNVGREDTGQQKFDALQAKLKELENPSNWMSYRHLTPEQKNKYIAQVRADLIELSNARTAEQKNLGRAEQTRLAAEAAMALDQEADSYRSNAAKRTEMKLAVKFKADNAYRQAVKDGNVELAKSIRADEAVVLAGIDKRYQDPKAKEDKTAANALKDQKKDYESINETINKHRAVLGAAAEATEKLTSLQKLAAQLPKDKDYLGLSPAQKARTDANLAAALAEDKINEARLKSNKLAEYSIDLSTRLLAGSEEQAEYFERELRSMGMSSKELEKQNDLYNAQDRAIQALAITNKKYHDEAAEGSAGHLAELKKIDDALQADQARVDKYYKDRAAKTRDWRNGATRAWKDFLDGANDTAGQTYNAFNTAFGAMESAIDQFAKTGKVKFREFASVVIAELLRIALTIAVSKILMSMFGGMDVGTKGSSYSDTAGFGASDGSFAKGAAFSGGQQLTSYNKGGVVNSATLFPMANGGTGLMGENGVNGEGILPLGRMNDGKLGIHARGGGDGGGVNITTQVFISSDGSSTTKVDSEEQSQQGKLMGELITSRIKEVLTQEQRQGGILWRMTNV